MLIVDRGSREPEVREELECICSAIRRISSGRYSYATYCFLEVIPPYIEDGISSCIDRGADLITILPYFLYPGTKLKDSVKRAAYISRTKDVRVAIAKPLSNNAKMINIVVNRVHETKRVNRILLPDSECDLMLIGHGSSDRRARGAFDFVVEMLKPHFRWVDFSFLELDKPDIMTGLKCALDAKPKCLFVVPYFLHKGTHIKYDVRREIRMSTHGQTTAKMYITEHLGSDGQLVDILLERATEVERGILA